MKKLLLGLLIGSVMFAFTGMANAGTATTPGTGATGPTVDSHTNAGTLYNVNMTVIDRAGYSNGNINFDYIYSNDMVLSPALVTALENVLSSPFDSLLSGIANENAAVLFNYIASGTMDGVAVKDNLTASTTNWSDFLAVINNQNIVPGRDYQLSAKGKVIPQTEASVNSYVDSSSYSFLTGTTSAVSYQYVDGVLTPVTSQVNEYSDVDIKTISLQKQVSPILLDITGKGTFEASNGQYMPHETTDLTKTIVTDFYGDGFEIGMEWVGPNDGILVAPKADGTVDMSCLFGTAGGYDTGYEKLSLYADANGIVKGDALKKLAVWQDKNGNGKADAGEVKTCAELGITSIDCRQHNFVSSFVMNGHTRKMVDWWPSAVELRTIATK